MRAIALPAPALRAAALRAACLRAACLLAAAGLLLSATVAAHAATLAKMPNAAGGHVGLTDTACPGAARGRVFYARVPSGATWFGCWRFDASANLYVLRWAASGRVTTYPPRDFHPTAYAEAAAKAAAAKAAARRAAARRAAARRAGQEDL